MWKKLILCLLVALSLITFSEFDAERFFYRISHPASRQPSAVQQDAISLLEGGRAVSLGMDYDDMLSRFGDPMDVLPSEYGFSWNIFHESFQNYIQIGTLDRRVVGIYTNSPRFSFRGITVGTSKADVNLILENALPHIVKGNTRFIANGLNNEQVHMDLFYADDMYITVFYDVFKNNSVTAIHIIEYETEQGFSHLYGESSPALGESFEKQNFYVTNALRVREGLGPLSYNEGAQTIARLHSADMAKQDYFDHTDLSGGSVSDRATAGGVPYRSIGENLAKGAQNSLYMHELLMNSEGHRKNILADFRSVGIGVAFDENDVPYLTQNFIG